MPDDIHQKIADNLPAGGYLECQQCGSRGEVGSVADRLKNGWPKCCGYTMRWKMKDECRVRKAALEGGESHE